MIELFDPQKKDKFLHDCHLPRTNQTEDILIHELVHNHSKSVLFDFIQKTLYLLPFKTFLEKNGNWKLYLIRILQQLCFKTKVYVAIQGCLSIEWYRSRNTMIYLFGENHNHSGNVSSILKHVSKHFACPIHVIVEKSFDTTWCYSVFSSYKSNSTSFYFPPLRICTTKGKVPRQTQLLQSSYKDYRVHCLEPYKGRIKFWGVDLRRTSVFYLVSEFWIQKLIRDGEKAVLDRIQFDKDYNMVFQYTKDFLKHIFNIPLYQVDKKRYNDIVLQTVSKCQNRMVKLDPTYNQMMKKNVKDMMNSDKSHLDFAQSLFYLSDTILETWRAEVIKTCENPLAVLLMMPIHDMYAILRMYRLIRQHEDGIILFFGGYWHMSNMTRLMQLIPYIQYRKETTQIPVDYVGQLQCSSFHTIKLPIPHIHCKTITPSMKLFA